VSKIEQALRMEELSLSSKRRYRRVCYRDVSPLNLLRVYASSKWEFQARQYTIAYITEIPRYNASLNFHAFRPKFEAVDKVMGHLTYTRKRYNPSEAPGGIGRCRRVWESTSRDVTLPSRSSGRLLFAYRRFSPFDTSISCNNFLNSPNAMKHAGHRPVIAGHWFSKTVWAC